MTDRSLRHLIFLHKNPHLIRTVNLKRNNHKNILSKWAMIAKNGFNRSPQVIRAGIPFYIGLQNWFDESVNWYIYFC